ncbi:hypothetical protein VP01_3567g2 [Puccinia sorghi]|uniref:Uncharacterized protein n=1 Tax=Puccinia sorghi TaxID=27349 RepID=A0A0L6UVE9_9BASI|nr:hypothetical protein VP01_3567g2 [Puccinia sorghi]
MLNYVFFFLEMIITHIIYSHYFMTFIFFFYVMISLRIWINALLLSLHKFSNPKSTVSITPDNPHHGILTKPTQLSQTIKISLNSLSYCSWKAEKEIKPLFESCKAKPIYSAIPSSLFPPQKMHHSCFHSPPSLPLNLPRLLCQVFDFVYGDRVELLPSAKQSAQNHNMIYIIKLISPLGYSSNHFYFIISKGFSYLGISSVYEQVQGKHLHASAMDTGLVKVLSLNLKTQRHKFDTVSLADLKKGLGEKEWLKEDIWLAFQALVCVFLSGCLRDPPTTDSPKPRFLFSFPTGMNCTFVLVEIQAAELNQVIKTYANFWLDTKFLLFRRVVLLMINGAHYQGFYPHSQCGHTIKKRRGFDKRPTHFMLHCWSRGVAEPIFGKPMGVWVKSLKCGFFFINLFGGQIETNLMIIGGIKYDKSTIRNQWIIQKLNSSLMIQKLNSSLMPVNYIMVDLQCIWIILKNKSHTFSSLKPNYLIYFKFNLIKSLWEKIKLTQSEKQNIQKARCTKKCRKINYYHQICCNLSPKEINEKKINNPHSRNLTCNPHSHTENYQNISP